MSELAPKACPCGPTCSCNPCRCNEIAEPVQACSCGPTCRCGDDCACTL